MHREEGAGVGADPMLAGEMSGGHEPVEHSPHGALGIARMRDEVRGGDVVGKS